MPLRKRKFDKKRPRRKATGNNSTAVSKVGYSSGYNLLPPKFVAKMRWCKAYNVPAGTADIINWFHFNMNGLYDPEVAVSAALQPNGFDQLMTEYSHYIVKGAKITVQFVHSAGNAEIVGVNTHRDVSTANLAGRDQFIVDPQTNYKVVSNDKPSATAIGYYSKKKVFDAATTTETLMGTITTNPTEQYIGSVGVVNMGPGLTQAAIDMIVTIDYIAEFSERNVIVKS